MGKLQSLWVPVTCRKWKAEFCKLGCIVLCLRQYESPRRAAVICSRGRLHFTTRPPLPSLSASTRNEVKEFNLDFPLFWLPQRRHATRLDAAVVFSPISKCTAKAQTETVRKSGTDITQMSAASRFHSLSRCAQPGRWHSAESPVAWVEGCQYKHIHVCTCTYTHVHAHTLVSLLHGSAVSPSSSGARETVGCVLLLGECIDLW